MSKIDHVHICLRGGYLSFDNYYIIQELLIIFQQQIYLINHKQLTTGWMLPSGNNSPPADVSIQEKTPYISYIVRTTHFWNNLHQVRSKSKYSIRDILKNNITVSQEEKSKLESSQQMIASSCVVPRIRCDPKVSFRTHDGLCNNMKLPLWWKLLTPRSRFIPPSHGGS